MTPWTSWLHHSWNAKHLNSVSLYSIKREIKTLLIEIYKMSGAAEPRNILREILIVGAGEDAMLPLSELALRNPISPDETVIQQRGLHKKLPTYNYDAPDPVFFKTPTKSPKKVPFHLRCGTPPKTTPIRSSPRKRLNASPNQLKFNEPDVSEMTISCKRLKRRLLENVKPGLLLSNGLEALSHAQLVQLITDAANSSPEVEQLIYKLLPKPDLTPAEEQLIKLKHNIYKSFPRNVWGSRDSTYCFLRVRTQLEVFKKECLEMCDQFMNSQHWPTVFEFIFIAWKYTMELPDWESVSHNKIKSICMKQLASQCASALKKANLDKVALCEVIERMQEFTSESAIESCIAFAKRLQMELA
ncbi:uncharacterized protein TNIN_361641 [Trichonephila inaurata madagascariensis]|uniref:Uncharacterized protein n=1 Tax=Trichonephila inaurata madagascariensis TaxID=2747483 RepID=A0A8X7C010_9ARAC|nr:uncharacterized protein TNIN_361641 [Trichonephila inaurata madagascariensis]